MGVKKHYHGKYHGDPLMMEVVAEKDDETMASIREEKPFGGARGVGERTFSKGDPLLKEAQRYHHEHDEHEAVKLALSLRRNKHDSLFGPNRDALFDPILEEYILPHRALMELRKVMEKNIADGIGTTSDEDLLKLNENDSLFTPHAGDMFDPVLHEYSPPATSMLEFKALKEDMIKKHQLFNEMQMRREHNLKNCELYCDNLVHSHRMRDLRPNANHATPQIVEDHDVMSTKAFPTKYRKLNGGDELMKASVKYQNRVLWASPE